MPKKLKGLKTCLLIFIKISYILSRIDHHVRMKSTGGQNQYVRYMRTTCRSKNILMSIWE